LLFISITSDFLNHYLPAASSCMKTKNRCQKRNVRWTLDIMANITVIISLREVKHLMTTVYYIAPAIANLKWLTHKLVS